MSEYRPWAVEEVMEEDATDGDAPADGAAPYTPWAAPAPLRVEVKEKRFESPPGLGEAPVRRKGQNVHETAAATLLWTGGFLLVASIAFVSVMTMVIGLEQVDMRYGGHSDYDDIDAMRDVRTAGAWGIPASLLFIAPGVGLLYHQSWARPIGFIGASISLLLGPVGLVLGIVGLVALSRMEGA